MQKYELNLSPISLLRRPRGLSGAFRFHTQQRTDRVTFLTVISFHNIALALTDIDKIDLPYKMVTTITIVDRMTSLSLCIMDCSHQRCYIQGGQKYSKPPPN